MIIKEFKLADDAYAKYKSYGKDLEVSLNTTLIRFQDVKPTSRIVVVPEKQRQELEVIFDRFIDSGEDLLAQVKKAMTLKVSGIEVTLAPDQLERIKQMSEFEGREFKAFLTEKVTEAIRYAIDGYM